MVWYERCVLYKMSLSIDSSNITYGHTLRITIPDKKQLLKSAVREIVQKILLRNPKIAAAKRLHKRPDGMYDCPICIEPVSRLTNAHVEKTHSQILDELINAYPDADLHKMVELDLREHIKPGVKYVQCCAKCNKEIESSDVIPRWEIDEDD
jgi:hypothetical protein